MGEGSSAGVKNIKKVFRHPTVMASPKGGEQESLPCALSRGSLTLETSIVLPFLLCAVTAMLYVFCDDRISGRKISDIDTAGTVAGGDCGTGSG